MTAADRTLFDRLLDRVNELELRLARVERLAGRQIKPCDETTAQCLGPELAGRKT